MNDLAVIRARFVFFSLQCLRVFFLLFRYLIPHHLFLGRFSRIIERDLGYLGDFLWISGAGLEHLHLLVHVGGVHPLGLVGAPVSPGHLGQQTLQLFSVNHCHYTHTQTKLKLNLTWPFSHYILQTALNPSKESFTPCYFSNQAL